MLVYRCAPTGSRLPPVPVGLLSQHRRASSARNHRDAQGLRFRPGLSRPRFPGFTSPASPSSPKSFIYHFAAEALLSLIVSLLHEIGQENQSAFLARI